MSLPQFGIFAQGTAAHHFQEFDIRLGVSPHQTAEALRQLREPAVAAGGVNIVLAFGPTLWPALAPDDAPSSLRAFAAVDGGDGRRAPATQHDVWLWVSGSANDVVFEHALAASRLLDPVAVLAAEQSCFVHRDSRDLTGFIDGTANPPLLEAPSVALIPPGEVGEAGSHVLVMRWVHDLEAFNALSIEDQERVFGRTKATSIELPGTRKPRSAHIARVEIGDSGGRELPIYRRSVPYGAVREHGLYFVAFSAELSRFDIMLSRMFGTAGDGMHDRLTAFSRPVSGACYFAPALSVLAELAQGTPGEPGQRLARDR